MPPKREVGTDSTPIQGNRRVRLNRAGHVLVDALAGTGKTFTIVEGINRIMGNPTPGVVGSDQQEAIWREITLGDRPSNVVVLAFNRSIKAEISKKLPPGANAYTCHGFGMQQLSKAGVRTGNVDNRKTSFILSDLYGCGDVFEFWRENRGYAPVVGKLVSLCKLNLVDYTMDDAEFRKEILRMADYHCIDIPPDYDKNIAMDIANVLHSSVKRTDVIDYDDMLWLPVAMNLAPKKVDLLFVDERQDLNRAQQELVYRAGKRIVMVGDVNHWCRRRSLLQYGETTAGQCSWL
jgi:superfamily I DNA/RNA helicase